MSFNNEGPKHYTKYSKKALNIVVGIKDFKFSDVNLGIYFVFSSDEIFVQLTL